MGKFVTMGGILVSLIGLASFWDDLNGWREVVAGNLIGSLAVVLGLLIVAYANRVRIRIWLRWATVGDWRNICRDWLLELGYTVKHGDDEDFIWSIIALDSVGHEVCVWVNRQERDVIFIGFAYNFLRTEGKQRAGESQELAEALILEMGRHGLLIHGLKAPMTRTWVSTKIPLDAELTRYRFMEVVDRVRIAIEPFVALVQQTERAIQSASGMASSQPQ